MQFYLLLIKKKKQEKNDSSVLNLQCEPMNLQLNLQYGVIKYNFSHFWEGPW